MPRDVGKQDEAAALSSFLCSSPDNTEVVEMDMPTPDPEAMQMEEEARKHFVETEMEHEELATNGNPSDQSQNGGAHAGCPTSNEDDTQC